jgi:hypothetical protein
MAPPPFDYEGVARMSREELVNELLKLNQGSTFQFTEDWLRRQWTHRLRSLLSASRRQHQPKEPTASGSQSAV